MTGRGKTFERRVSNGLRETSGWWYRIPDYQHFFPRTLKPFRQMKAPADFLTVQYGHMYLIECKSTRSRKSFPFDRLESHQEESLLQASKHDGLHSLVLMEIIGERNEMRCWGLTIEQFQALKQKRKDEGFKSAKWGHIHRAGIEIFRRGRGYYLDPLFVNGRPVQERL